VSTGSCSSGSKPSKKSRLDDNNATLAAVLAAAAAATTGSFLVFPVTVANESVAASGPAAGYSPSGFALPIRPELLTSAASSEKIVPNSPMAVSFGGGGVLQKGAEMAPPSEPAPLYTVSTRALRGGRLYMEDEYFVSKGGRFAGVFDGHGGRGVSSHLKENLHNKIQYYLQNLHSKKCHDDDYNVNYPSISTHVAAIQAAFADVDTDVMNDPGLEHEGSTAVTVTLHQSPSGEQTILSANVGDSRAILSRDGIAVDLTRDHKPNEEKEKERILATGETIEWDAYCHVWRVRNLSLSRAIGDKFAKPAISGEPEIKRFPVSEKDEFVLLASDGVWDVMASQEVVDFVKKRLDAATAQGGAGSGIREKRIKNMSRYVANEALRRGSGDNICVVMVWLKE